MKIAQYFVHCLCLMNTYSAEAMLYLWWQAMALELGKYNIRVNAIAAGLFKSEITNDLFAKDWLNEVATKIVPAGKWGNVDPDLTSVILLLASDESQYITGNIFVVDGGQSMPGIPIWSSL